MSNYQMSGKRKKDFPNNWKKYSELDSSSFLPIEFDEFMDWKVYGWEIPGNICCLIRERNYKTNKVKEHVYQRPSAADRKIKQLSQIPHCEFIICTNEHVATVPPDQDQENIDSDEDCKEARS